MEPLDAARSQKLKATKQPDPELIPKGFRSNPGMTPEILETWSASKLDLATSYLFYGLPEGLPRLAPAADLSAATMREPQEVWGFLSGGKARKNFISAFTGGEAMVVEVENLNVIGSEKVSFKALKKYRKGVLLEKNY